MKIAVTRGNSRIGQAVVAIALSWGHTTVNIALEHTESSVGGVANKRVGTTNYDTLRKSYEVVPL